MSMARAFCFLWPRCSWGLRCFGSHRKHGLHAANWRNSDQGLSAMETIRFTASSLPLMARNGHAGAVRRRLLLRVERTCRSSEPTSDFDPERTRTGGSFAMRRMVCVQSMLYHSPSFPWGKPDEAAEVYCLSRWPPYHEPSGGA